MRQITLTLCRAPGDYIDQLPTYHTQLVLLIRYFFLLFSLQHRFVEFFLLESGLSYFLVLAICLLLVSFVSAAGCHCFDLYLQ